MTREGLSEAEAKRRLSLYGPNVIEEEKPINVLKLFFDQFKDPLVLLLLAASVLSLIIGEATDAYLIVAIVVLNGLLGFFQEYRAEKAVRALKGMLKPVAKVIREGKLRRISIEEVVPGDVVVLEEGDIIPADVELVEAKNMAVNEALLTGESVPVEKRAGERAYMGTVVVRGRGKGVVVATGKRTEMGKIAESVLKIEEGKSVFDVEMEKLSSLIGKITLAVAAVVVAVYLVQGMDVLDALSVGIALAVAAVPEGLPIVVTLALSLGVLQMVRKNALVRRLKSVETLGAVDVICTDKTGTITENKMRVVEFEGDERWIKIVAACCNNADPESDIGDPMEIALKLFAGEVRCNRIDEIPFSSERKMMTVVVEIEGKRYILTKGAPERIEELVGLSLRERVEAMAKRGLRVLALAYKEDDGRPEQPPYMLAGIVGLLDPPREGVREAVERARRAGIRTVMITGDHRTTAERVARMVGIEGEVVTGEELDRMSDEELERRIENIGVFARVNPSHKLRIVRTLQRRGHVVAMTGDGVNDAPALKAADVGIALGSGTDVAKGVADIILLDDNYVTIVEAIKEGRRIFDNIKKFVLYLLSANTGEVVGVFGASLMGKILLKPAHLLLLNLFTDGLPAVALALDPARPNIMEEPPRKKGEPVLKRKDLLIGVGLLGLLIGLGMIAVYLTGLPGGIERAWGATLIGFVVLEFARLQTIRKEPIMGNPFLLLALLASIGIVLLIVYTPLASLFSVKPPLPDDIVEIAIITAAVYVLAKALKA